MKLKGDLQCSDLEISCKSCEEFSTPALSEFLVSLTGKNHSSTVASITQDIVYATTDQRTPKHVALAMSLRKYKRSKEILTTLNRLGHTVSYSDITRIETSAARTVLNLTRELGVFLPPGLQKGVFVVGAFDNIDFEEHTPDGKRTTHATNLILYQSQKEDAAPLKFKIEAGENIDISMQLPGSGDLYTDIDVSSCLLTAVDREPDLPCINAQANCSDLEDCISVTHEWVHARRNDGTTPTWQAYNGRKMPAVQDKTHIAYLPMLNMRSTETKTIYKCLKIMQRSAELLDQENSVVVVDQAIYQLAQRLKWNKPDEFKNVVILMGGVPCFPELFGSTRSFCGRIWMARHS